MLAALQKLSKQVYGNTWSAHASVCVNDKLKIAWMGEAMSGLMIRSLFVGAGLLLATASTPASAYFIAGVTVTNTYSYSFTDAAGTVTDAGEQSTVLSSNQRPIPTSQLGVDLVGQANSDSFYFLHNDYCVGKCQITSSTTISFLLDNEEGTDGGVRFDSLITPGHLAFVALGNYANTSASFAFSVDRTDVAPTGAPGNTTSLYSATGSANGRGITVQANGMTDPFNNTITGTNEGAGVYYDWSATPLNVELGELGFLTQIDYTASYTVQSDNLCSDLLNCTAAQVVFGDPRTTGGGTTSAAKSLALAAFDAPIVDGGIRPVINREYDSSTVPYAFVPSGSDPSVATPDPEPALTYVGNYVPSLFDTDSAPAVPEPATWASMVLGFGVIGNMLRRRRTLLRPGAA